jgi:hypothetical protein
MVQRNRVYTYMVPALEMEMYKFGYIYKSETKICRQKNGGKKKINGCSLHW